MATRTPRGRPLARAFYARHVVSVARAILGRLLVHDCGGRVVSGRVVEVEAYRGDRDPASHAYRGRTARNAVMFGPAGHAYVYFTYGMHHCLNLVAEDAAHPAAVLLRALEPVEGIEWMRARRGLDDDARLARGPACVARALGIGREHDGTDLVRGCLWLSDLPARRHGRRIVSGPRIGIRRGTDLRWRFWLEGHPCVSALRRAARRRRSTAGSRRSDAAPRGAPDLG